MAVKKEIKLVDKVSKPKNIEKAKNEAKPKSVTKAELKTKGVEKAKRVEKVNTNASSKKKGNRITRWWRSTIGELRKVSWPTTQEAWRLTKIVLIVVFSMAVILGLLDFLFSRAIAALVSI